MRIELDDTALVRPSNAAPARGAGIGGIDDDRREAARIERRGEREPDQPTAEDDHVRSIHGRAPNPFVAMTPRLRLTADSALGDFKARTCWGWDDGNRGDARTEARTGARLAGCAARRRAALRRAHARRAADRRQPRRSGCACDAQFQRSFAEHGRGRSADQLARQLRRLFQRRAAAAVRPRRGAVPAGDCHRGLADGPAGTGGPDRPRLACSPPSAPCCLASRSA